VTIIKAISRKDINRKIEIFENLTNTAHQQNYENRLENNTQHIPNETCL